MATADRSTDDVTFRTVQARNRDGSVAALSALQQATSGNAPSLDVRSDNSSAPAARMRAPGTVLDVLNSSGASQFTVGQSGITTLTVASGGATVTGNSTVTGSLDVDGYALGEVTPDAQGLLAWTYDPIGAVNNITLTGGTI